MLGPPLNGRFGKEAQTMTGPVSFDAAYVADSLTNPMGQIAMGFAPAMPPAQLNEEEIAAIVAYLESLP